MAKYKIFEKGEEVNRIEADEVFCEVYCAENGYTYEPEPMPEPEPTNEPTADELLKILAGVSV